MSEPAVPLGDELRSVVRGRILGAARNVLAERGLDATVDDVAAAAGVSRRTVFRHFATRERLFAETIRESLHRYSELLRSLDEGDESDWLERLVDMAHHFNAQAGRAYWELAVMAPELPGELAAIAAKRRTGRHRFTREVAERVWRAEGGRRSPPDWLVDAFAVHLSPFATQALAGDFGRSPDDTARVSARILRATVRAALEEARR